jgi:hypothetical protein
MWGEFCELCELCVVGFVLPVQKVANANNVPRFIAQQQPPNH